MKIATFSRFNGWVGPASSNEGGGALHPAVRFVAIAPGSDVDACLVNGRLLTPGVVLPVAEGATLVPWRSLPSGGIAGGNAGVTDAVDQLELLTWTACENPIAPGPLAPRLIEAVIPFGDFAVSNAYTVPIRLGIQGRASFNAIVTNRLTGGTVSAVTTAFRTVAYLSRRAIASDPSLEPYAFEATQAVGADVAVNADPLASSVATNALDGNGAAAFPSPGWLFDEIQIRIAATHVLAPTGGAVHVRIAAVANEGVGYQ